MCCAINKDVYNGEASVDQIEQILSHKQPLIQGLRVPLSIIPGLKLSQKPFRGFDQTFFWLPTLVRPYIIGLRVET